MSKHESRMEEPAFLRVLRLRGKRSGMSIVSRHDARRGTFYVLRSRKVSARIKQRIEAEQASRPVCYLLTVASIRRHHVA